MKEEVLKEVPFGATVLWEERQWTVRPASEKPDETRRRLFEIGRGTATVLLSQEVVVVVVTSVN